jgi:hypothetical protein
MVQQEAAERQAVVEAPTTSARLQMALGLLRQLREQQAG